MIRTIEPDKPSGLLTVIAASITVKAPGIPPKYAQIGVPHLGIKDIFLPIKALTTNNTKNEVTAPTPCATHDASKGELKAASSLLTAIILANVIPPARAKDKLID